MLHRTKLGFGLFYWLGCVSACTVAACVLGGKVEFSDQMRIVAGLQQTASIIFAVLGAWVAIIYPKTLSHLLDRNRPVDPEKAERVRKLVEPMLVSTIVLGALIIGSWSGSMVRAIKMTSYWQEWTRTGSFFILGILSGAQLWALLLSLVPLDVLHRDIDRAEARKQQLRRKL